MARANRDLWRKYCQGNLLTERTLQKFFNYYRACLTAWRISSCAIKVARAAQPKAELSVWQPRQDRKGISTI
jgi:hypothetical protein